MAVLPASDEELWYHLAIFAAVWAAFFWTVTTGGIAFVPTGLDGVGDIGLTHVFVGENLVLAMSFRLTELGCPADSSSGSNVLLNIINTTFFAPV